MREEIQHVKVIVSFSWEYLYIWYHDVNGIEESDFSNTLLPFVQCFYNTSRRKFSHFILPSDHCIPVLTPGKYSIILDSDRLEFGGHAKLDSKIEYFSSS